MRGELCQALAGADAILHGLDPRLGVATSVHQQLPGTPVLLKQRYTDGGVQPVPAGCTPLVPECSVRGQIEALHKALGSVSHG